jgi:hypothetical protein
MLFGILLELTLLLSGPFLLQRCRTKRAAKAIKTKRPIADNIINRLLGFSLFLLFFGACVTSANVDAEVFGETSIVFDPLNARVVFSVLIVLFVA